METNDHSGVKPALFGSGGVVLAGVILGVVALGGLGGCSPRSPASGAAGLVIREVDPPRSGPGAMAARLAPRPAGGALLSWLERGPEDGETGGDSMQLQVADWSLDHGWGAGEVVARGSGFFANWADLPMVLETTFGTRYGLWLEKLDHGTYDYGIQTVWSSAAGSSWLPLGWIHDDTTAAEHGFVSAVALPDGAAEVFWLDGREMPAGGAMGLRSSRVEGQVVAASELLDPRVCECCATDATLGADGPIVVYRDRTEDEIRDIALVRRVHGEWSAPIRVHDDGWQIEGCPVNGPAVAARDTLVAVAWYTAAEGRSLVQVAFSNNGGVHFDVPIVVAEKGVLGRVDLAVLHEDTMLVSWVEETASGAEIRVRSVRRDGTFGESRAVASTTAKRSSGFPRMVTVSEGTVLIVWLDAEQGAGLRAAQIRQPGP